jgi:glycosyltransferase involved in cell wall biosynthesis
MRVLFYEPAHTGHHFAYLAWMLGGFVDLPVKITVATTPSALGSVEYAKTLAPLADRITFVTSCTPPPAGPIKIARHRLRELVECIEAVRPDHVAVCYVDGVWDQACLATLMGRRPWPRELVVEGWLYRGRFGDRTDRRWKSIVRRGLFRRLLRQGLFRKLHLDHELLYNFAAPFATGTSTEVVLTPNPIELREPVSREEARRRLGLPTEGRWISLSGVVARFKGADLLIEVFSRCRRERPDMPLRLLLAGPQEEQIRAMLQREPYRALVAEGGIVAIDRFVNEEEMFLAAAAADLVVAPYPNHDGRSSIILWAAAAGRPSLGTEEGCIGHVIKHERLGRTCNVADTSALADAVVATLDMPWTDADADRVRQYAEFHRVENYRRIASQLIRQRLEEQGRL